MIIVEMQRDDQAYAEQIAEKAEMATMAVAPKSFSSELNDIIQVVENKILLVINRLRF